MRQWSGLPYEILISIFEEVGNCPKDLQSCQLTCKNWSKAAHTQLCSSIQLSDSTSVKLFLEQLPNTGKLVKSIHFFGKFYQPCLNEYAFVRIFQACPNVEVISAPGIQNIWLDLQRQREQGHLQAVKQLIMPEFKRHVDLYISTIIVFRSTIEQLLLGEDQIYWYHPQSTHRTMYDKVLERMDEFTSLKKLSVNLMTKNSMVCELESFIDRCPRVTKLDFLAYEPDQQFLVIANKNISNLDLIKPHASMRSFKGGITALTDETVNYFMHKFPHLTNVTLNKSYYSPYTRIEKPASKLSPIFMTKFFQYVTSMDHYEIWDVVSPTQNEGAVASFFNATPANTKNRLNIEYEDPDYCNSIIFTAKKEEKDGYNTVLIELPLETGKQDLPHFNILKQCGPRLDALFINASQLSVSGNQEDYSGMIINKTLETVFKECTTLKTFDMFNMNFSEKNADKSQALMSRLKHSCS